MESNVNIEQVMDEIRAQAKGGYEPGAEFAPTDFSTGKKLHLALRRVGRKAKAVTSKVAGKVVRVFVAMYLFAKNQLKDGKNVILDTAAKTNELTGYVHGDLEHRLAALEQENAALKTRLDELCRQDDAHGV